MKASYATAATIFKSLSVSFLRTAMDLHSTYVLALRHSHSDTKLRIARREAVLAQSLHRHLLVREKKFRTDAARRSQLSHGLRATAARVEPHSFNPNMAEQLEIDIDTQLDFDIATYLLNRNAEADGASR